MNKPNDETPVPYVPDEGSALSEMKKIADEEAFLEATGVNDEEDHRKKLEKLDDDFYNNSQQEQWEEDARRGKVLEYRLANGEISEKYKWMVSHKGYEAEDFQSNFDKLLREAMKDESWDYNNYDTYMRYVHLEQQAEVALMREIFPKFGDYLTAELKKAKEQNPDQIDSNIVRDAIRHFLDGADIESKE